MMLKSFKILCVCFLVIFKTSNCLEAQVLDPEIYSNNETQVRKNSIYGELFGSGFFLSLNYERELYRDEKVKFNFRIGTGTAILVNAVPLAGVNLLFGKNNNNFELGFNGIRTYAISVMGGDGNYVLANPVLGYRYVSDKGLIFRASFTPFFQLYDPDDWVTDELFVPFAGISLGYSF
jgi:hypothetical protein